MKIKHGLLFGFAVFLATAMFTMTLAGCPTGTNDESREDSKETASSFFHFLWYSAPMTRVEKTLKKQPTRISTIILTAGQTGTEL
jgi:hypothetical protein